MKISISVILVLTTLCCVLPYLWFILIGINNNKKKEKLFKDVIKDETLTLQVKEQWNDTFIGLDQFKNNLVFIKIINQEITYKKIDLSQLKSCEINRKTKEFKKENGMKSELQSLDLELTMESSEVPISLNFYNSKEGFLEDLELKRAEKWQTFIQQSKLKVILHKKAA